MQRPVTYDPRAAEKRQEELEERRKRLEQPASPPLWREFCRLFGLSDLT
jgi:hypothetical protein